MGRVVHFEIHADDPERAAAFYRGVFGWQIAKWDGAAEYWLVTTGDPGERGIDGAILRRPVPVAGMGANAFVCTAQVDDVSATLAQALASGGELAMAEMDVPGVGRLAYARDTEGNVFGMLQPVAD
ncbi:MAG TPA: VOC family protein [Conexibacter sp.]|nr:VOC family protein [Conexibacter sp.]